MSLRTPVVFVVFRRPGLTTRVLERIRDAQPERLWVLADGAHTNRPEEASQVAAVRRLIDEQIDWPCDVRRIYSETNLGCASRVISGLNEVFACEEEAIILEDDCLPDSSFFPFCEELLTRFTEHPQIAAIGGNNFQASGWACEHSYYFSKYFHCWGWATWRRMWAQFDPRMSSWTLRRKESWLASKISHPSEERYWHNAFDGTASGTINSWAYAFTYECWQRGMLSVVPAINLVSNIGFQADATHTSHPSEFAAMPTGTLQWPLKHPSAVIVNGEADRYTALRNYAAPSLPRRILRRLRRIVVRR